jgi:hypothetical protein
MAHSVRPSVAGHIEPAIDALERLPPWDSCRERRADGEAVEA